MGHYSSFVVKIWVDEESGMSRGYVQHVGTQEGMHFLALDKMAQFMMDHLGSSPSQSTEPLGTPLQFLPGEWKTQDEYIRKQS